MKRIAIILFSLFIALNSKSHAQDTAVMPPIEVKAIRASVLAPFAKINLYKKDIERQNLGQDLPFLLNQTPSTVINSDAGNGVGYTYIHIRGTDASRINITLNGIPYNDAESQGTFFVDLPDFASSVSSIQIQRGVGTSTNGPGSFGATINFSTNEVNKNAFAELNNSYGSFYTMKNTISAGSGLLGKHFTTDIRLSRISSSGYIDRAASNLQSLYFSTAYLSDKSEFRFNIIAGKEKTYQAWYGVSDTDLPFHRTINYAGMEKPGGPYENETDNYWQNHYQLFFTRHFSKNTNFSTAIFYTKGYGYFEEYRAGQDYKDYRMPYPVNGTDTSYTTDLIRRLWLNNDFYGGIISLIHRAGKSEVTLGGALTSYSGAHYGIITWAQHGITGNPEWYRLNAYKTDGNAYAKWQHDLVSSIQLFADAQVRRVNYDLGGFEHNPALIINPVYTFFNPKAGISFHRNNWLAYFSYSISNKEPNRDDFEAGLYQQPKPEHLKDFELGIEKRLSKSMWAINFYYMKYKDQLVLTGKINDVGAYTRTNIPDSYRMGVEMQGSIIFCKFLKASCNLTISENKISRFTEFIDDYDNGGQKMVDHANTDIAFSPSLISAATVTVNPSGHLNIDLLSKYVSGQYLDNSGNSDRVLHPYFTEDIRAIYSFSKLTLKNLSFIFQVNNVFSRKYEPAGYTYSYFSNAAVNTANYYFPMAGRNIMAGINMKF